MKRFCQLLALSVFVIGFPGCGKKTSLSDKKPNDQAEKKWTPDASKLANLQNESNLSNFGEYTLRPPKGYIFQQLPPIPSQIQLNISGGAWVGSVRSDGTRAQLMINIIKTPSNQLSKYSPDDRLSKRVNANAMYYQNWKRTETERGKIGDISFVRAYWHGIHKKTNHRMHGFCYVANTGREMIYLSSQDVEPHHKNSLSLAEAAVLTFKKR